MFFKIPLVLGIMYLYVRSRNALLSAGLWGGLIFVLGIAINGGISFPLILGGVLSFLLAFGLFSLLDYLEDGAWWWPTLILGMFVLLLI